MATVDLLAGTVMNAAASLMNDSARTKYTYVAQVPYVNIALQELQEDYELHSLPVTQQTSAIINIPAGQTAMVFNAIAPIPALPTDMVEPGQLWERSQGINPFIPMTKRDYLPHDLEGVLLTQFMYYVWISSQIQFLPASQSNDIKIDYIKQLFTPVVNESSLINVINAQTFLEYRTAGLLAEFIERNTTSANAMNAYAMLAENRALGIGSKGKQNIMTRRRPFRSGYKRGGWVT